MDHLLKDGREEETEGLQVSSFLDHTLGVPHSVIYLYHLSLGLPDSALEENPVFSSAFHEMLCVSSLKLLPWCY